MGRIKNIKKCPRIRIYVRKFKVKKTKVKKLSLV